MGLVVDILSEVRDAVRAIRAEIERRADEASAHIYHHPKADPRLSISQAAEYASVHPQTIRQACSRRELDHERSGTQGHIRIRLSALEAWLSRDRVRALRGA